MSYYVGQIIIYENRRCRIDRITENTVELTNLESQSGDWLRLRVEISNINLKEN